MPHISLNAKAASLFLLLLPLFSCQLQNSTTISNSSSAASSAPQTSSSSSSSSSGISGNLNQKIIGKWILTNSVSQNGIGFITNTNQTEILEFSNGNRFYKTQAFLFWLFLSTNDYVIDENTSNITFSAKGINILTNGNAIISNYALCDSLYQIYLLDDSQMVLSGYHQEHFSEYYFVSIYSDSGFTNCISNTIFYQATNYYYGSSSDKSFYLHSSFIPASNFIWTFTNNTGTNWILTNSLFAITNMPYSNYSAVNYSEITNDLASIGITNLYELTNTTGLSNINDLISNYFGL